MVGKEAVLGCFRHVPRSSGEKSWSQYCSSWSSLQWERSENICFVLQVIHFCSVAAVLDLTFSVLKPMTRCEITEFKIQTDDSNFISTPKNIMYSD